MRTRPLISLVSLVALAAAACTRGGNDQTELPELRSDTHDVVVLQTDDGSIALDSLGGVPLVAEPGSVASFDGSMLFRATSGASDDTTTLTTTDALTGSEVATRTVPGELDVRVASVSGELVAMMEPFASGFDAWTPVPRAETEIVVADPSGGRILRYSLTGNYEPEAFSTDDTKLFLIEYLPAEAPAVYRVTVLNLATGGVRNVFGKFKAPPERMPGIRLSHVYDPVKERLYTLYSNEAPAYLDSPYEDQMEGAVTFVHVLSLRRGWAFCAGVPEAMWGGHARDQAMAVSPDGAELYIVDTLTGLTTVMDTKTMKLLRTEQTPFGTSDGVRASATVSSDGSTLFVGSSSDGQAIYQVDTATLSVLGRWDLGDPIGALGLSPDGLRLYAALSDQIVGIDPASGTAIGSFGTPARVDSILGVHTPGP
jgi:hypothetical protein